MADYYYTKLGSRQGPVPEAELRALIARGEVTATDHYWTEGMGEWMTVDDGTLNPASPAPTSDSTAAPAPVASAPAAVQSPFGSGSVTAGAGGDLVPVKDIALKMPKPIWLIIPASMAILAGVITGITIIGLIFAWLPIWLGVLLFQANKALETARDSGRRQDLITAVEKISTYFTITGVVALIYLLFIIIYIVFLVTVGADLFNNFNP